MGLDDLLRNLLMWLAGGLSSSHMSLSIGLLECLHDMVADFLPPTSLEQMIQKCKQGVSPDAFYDQVLEITHCHFCFILFVRSKLSLDSSRGDFGEDECQKFVVIF